MSYFVKTGDYKGESIYDMYDLDPLSCRLWIKKTLHRQWWAVMIEREFVYSWDDHPLSELPQIKADEKNNLIYHWAKMSNNIIRVYHVSDPEPRWLGKSFNKDDVIFIKYDNVFDFDEDRVDAIAWSNPFWHQYIVVKPK